MEYETAKAAFNAEIARTALTNTPGAYLFHFTTDRGTQHVSFTIALADLNEDAIAEDYQTWYNLMTLTHFITAHPEDRQPAYAYLETGHNGGEIDFVEMFQSLIAHYYGRRNTEYYVFPKDSFEQVLDEFPIIEEFM